MTTFSRGWPSCRDGGTGLPPPAACLSREDFQDAKGLQGVAGVSSMPNGRRRGGCSLTGLCVRERVCPASCLHDMRDSACVPCPRLSRPTGPVSPPDHRPQRPLGRAFTVELLRFRERLRDWPVQPAGPGGSFRGVSMGVWRMPCSSSHPGTGRGGGRGSEPTVWAQREDTFRN